MPSWRQASSRVAPSGTRTVCPSTVTSTSRFGVSRKTAVMSAPYQAEADGGLYGGDRRLAEAADRGVAGHRADVVEERELLGGRPEWRAARHPGQDLFLADGPDPAGHALPAGLVAEELGDPPQQAG